MTHEDPNGFPYYESLDEVRADGYAPVKVWSLLQFYILKGRTTNLVKQNLEPFPNLKYLVLNGENRYYVRTFAGWSVDDLYFYYQDRLNPENEAIENLRRYVYDGKVWLLLTKDHVEQTTLMLQRLWKANLEGEGKVDYRLYLQILDRTLKRDDYAEMGKNLIGYKTALKIMDGHIADLWKQVYEKK